MNNKWGSFIGSSRKPLRKTSQWNYVLYLYFGLPFKTCALVSILSKNIPIWSLCYWRVFSCYMRFHLKKIGLPCLMHIHENEILPVKLSTVRMECNGRKYCSCRRWFNSNCIYFITDLWVASTYIRLDLGFQYGLFSCDGSRFLCIIIMHCIVNVENHQY